MQQADVVAPVGKLRRIVQHQDGADGAGEPLPRRTKVPSQNVRLRDPRIGEEPVRGLGIRPVLAREGNAFGRGFGQILQHGSEPFAQSFVGKLTTDQFLIHPRIDGSPRSLG